ncbi:MAG: hypothetical protein GZ085_00470 [Sulfuriferula multivorans]|uniref:Uncharacterized protein n=1 Tax=Sulfuriferula multivorans TaxID=1559896 RepID=A0A7C9NSW8_9PROT|nr:hypothetical protein [Sulfuriferula multivorans]
MTLAGSLPESGPLENIYDGQAPFRIKTTNAGEHYYVKLTHPGSTVPVVHFFIRSGGTIEADVPLGTYELKYATGKDWSDAESHFGPRTNYWKSGKRVTFSFDGNQYAGNEVQLIMQRTGNLSRTKIQKKQF